MNRSTIKSNSCRRISDSTSENKVGNGIFKKVSSYDEKNVSGDREELPVCVRETMSESITQNKNHYKGIVSWLFKVHIMYECMILKLC